MRNLSENLSYMVRTINHGLKNKLNVNWGIDQTIPGAFTGWFGIGKEPILAIENMTAKELSRWLDGVHTTISVIKFLTASLTDDETVIEEKIAELCNLYNCGCESCRYAEEDSKYIIAKLRKNRFEEEKIERTPGTILFFEDKDQDV